MEQLSASTEPRETPPPLLYGVAAIASYVGIKPEAARHLIRKEVIPAFKIGRTVCALPSHIDQALEELGQRVDG